MQLARKLLLALGYDFQRAVELAFREPVGVWVAAGAGFLLWAALVRLRVQDKAGDERRLRFGRVLDNGGC